ncbi:PCMD domain-containing protein [Bacteroides faecichinchillae]|uniref:PCMD domain-containing protein n=1 Tax=Bacteroides faecichinchillae TaxID=871325 RepID=UPI003518D5F1
MKKSLFCLYMLICSVGFFTSCSDDEPNYSAAIEGEIAGNYKGTLEVKLFGESIGNPIIQKITVSKASNTSIDLSLKNFSFMGIITIPEIKLSNCKLTKNGDTYSFVGTQELETGELSCVINATGTIKKGNINIDMDIKAILDGQNQDVDVTYKGARLSGTESSEAKITSFIIENNFVIGSSVIDDVNGTITFKVSNNATDEDLSELIPEIVVSNKATVNPESGVAQDFSAGKKVTYTVLAEDGTAKTYVASVDGNILRYSFDEWSDVAQGGTHPYYDPLPTNELANPNKGVALLYSVSGYKGDYPVLQEETGFAGKAIKLITRYTKKQGGFINSPTITAGSLFTGEMVISISSMSKPLEATHFGIPYNKKPLFFKGYYKYTPGETFLEGAKDGSKDNIIEGQVDECSIVAVLYQIEKDDEYLDGTNINSSPKRVAVAYLEDGSAKSEFTPFNLKFNFLPDKSYDPNAKYKIAIVCSASKEGDSFKGAPDSTLILDELEIIGE